MPLYNVELEGILVVAADSEASALARAQALIDSREVRFHEDLSAVDAYRIHTVADLADAWTPDCLPYGTTDHQTIADHLG